MKKFSQIISVMGVFSTFLAVILGCGGEGKNPVAEWTKSKKIAGKEQKLSHISGIVVDEKFVYWVTPTSILKQAKSGGKVEIVYQATDKEGVDELSQDAETLYFGFRGAGESRWDLRKISKTGGEPTTLVKRYSLKPVVVDDTNVYFFNGNGMSSELLCKISKTGGEATTLDSGYSSGVITQSKTQVYFASLDDIYSFQK